MKDNKFNLAMELMKLIVYFITIICSIFIGFHLSAVHYQNELLKQDELILDLYLDKEDYENAGIMCDTIQNYVNFISQYDIAFFDIDINVDELSQKCGAISYKPQYPEWNFTYVYIPAGEK